MLTWVPWVAIVMALSGAMTAWGIYASRGRRRWAGYWVGALVALIIGASIYGFDPDEDSALLYQGAYFIVSVSVLLFVTWRLLPVLKKTCPDCSKLVPANATICKHCAHDFLTPKQRRNWHWVHLGMVSGIVCLLGALTGIILVSPFRPETVYLLPEAGPETGQIVATATPTQLTKVVVATNWIARGERINPYAVALMTWPVGSIPYGALMDTRLAQGGMARTDIAPGQIIVSRMLAYSPDQLVRVGETYSLSPSGSLLLNQPVNGLLDKDRWRDEWSFVGKGGETYTLFMDIDTGDLSPVLMVWAENSEEWIEGKRDFSTRSAALTFEIPQDGVYVVVATQTGLESGHAAGHYCLILRQDSSTSHGCSG